MEKKEFRVSGVVSWANGQEEMIVSEVEGDLPTPEEALQRLRQTVEGACAPTHPDIRTFEGMREYFATLAEVREIKVSSIQEIAPPDLPDPCRTNARGEKLR